MLSLISILSKIRIICHSQCLRTLIFIVTKSPTPKSLPMFSGADFRVIKCAKPCHWLCFRTHFRVISSTKILLMSLFSNTDFHANKSVKLLSMSILLKTFSCKTHVTANTYEHWFSCCQKRESYVTENAFEHWFSCSNTDFHVIKSTNPMSQPALSNTDFRVVIKSAKSTILTMLSNTFSRYQKYETPANANAFGHWFSW